MLFIFFIFDANENTSFALFIVKIILCTEFLTNKTQTWVFNSADSTIQNQVQRRLQLRIEAQSRYLQSILEKACKALNDQAAATAGLEAAREELSELAIKAATIDSHGSTLVLPIGENGPTTMPARIGDCSVDSCLTSNGSPVSPMGSGVISQVAALKKRQRAVFSTGDSQVVDGNFRQEWRMANIGWLVVLMDLFFFFPCNLCSFFFFGSINPCFQL